MKECRYADEYKAEHPPRCGGEEGPCDVCAQKWADKNEYPAKAGTAEKMLALLTWIDEVQDMDAEVMWDALQEESDYENLSKSEIISRVRANLKNKLNVLDYLDIKGEDE